MQKRSLFDNKGLNKDPYAWFSYKNTHSIMRPKQF